MASPEEKFQYHKAKWAERFKVRVEDLEAAWGMEEARNSTPKLAELLKLDLAIAKQLRHSMYQISRDRNGSKEPAIDPKVKSAVGQVVDEVSILLANYEKLQTRKGQLLSQQDNVQIQLKEVEKELEKYKPMVTHLNALKNVAANLKSGGAA